MNSTSRPQSVTQRHAEKLDATMLGLACWIPIIAFLALFGFAAVAWGRVGHWPYYANPDPKDLALPFLHAAALLAYPLALVSIPACLLVVILSWHSLKRRGYVHARSLAVGFYSSHDRSALRVVD